MTITAQMIVIFLEGHGFVPDEQAVCELIADLAVLRPLFYPPMGIHNLIMPE